MAIMNAEDYTARVAEIVLTLKQRHEEEMCAMRSKCSQLQQENDELKRELRRLRGAFLERSASADAALDRLERSIESLTRSQTHRSSSPLRAEQPNCCFGCTVPMIDLASI